MFGIVLISYLSYRNGMMAKIRGLNSIAWALYTVFAYVAGSVAGCMVVLFLFCKNTIDINQLAAGDPAVGSQKLQQVFFDHPLHLATMILFGIGGYLLVRYLLEKKAGGKNTPGPTNVNWMDKLGE